MGHATLESVRLFGTRSADYIRASGHSGCIATEVVLQAKQAEYMTAPERFAEIVRFFPCTAGAVHTWHITSASAMQRYVRSWVQTRSDRHTAKVILNSPSVS